MADMHEAIEMLHKARNLVQRIESPSHDVPRDDLLGFLADSEAFLADGCGVRVHYLSK